MNTIGTTAMSQDLGQVVTLFGFHQGKLLVEQREYQQQAVQSEFHTGEADTHVTLTATPPRSATFSIVLATA